MVENGSTARRIKGEVNELMRRMKESTEAVDNVVELLKRRWCKKLYGKRLPSDLCIYLLFIFKFFLVMLKLFKQIRSHNHEKLNWKLELLILSYLHSNNKNNIIIFWNERALFLHFSMLATLKQVYGKHSPTFLISLCPLIFSLTLLLFHHPLPFSHCPYTSTLSTF